MRVRTTRQQKKKQASIAAFFSPRAKSSPVSPPPAAPVAPAAPVSADAPPKKQRKSPKSAAGGAKRPRATSSPKLAAQPAGETPSDGIKEQPANLRSPASPEAVATPSPSPAKAAVVDVSETPSKSDASGKRTIVELFATPPPPKRAKKSDVAVDAVVNEKEKEAAASETSEQLQLVAAEDSDEVLSGDEDLSGGPHAIGPPAATPGAHKPAGRPRGRKAPKAAAAAPAPAAASRTRTKVAAAAAKDDAPDAATATTPKAKEKKQPARAAKEKAAEAAAPAAEQKPPPPPVVLDPLVKARVATYQQKIDELTQQCTHLLQAPGATDGVLQEIYGLAVDLGLELDDSHQTGELGKTIAALFSDLAREQTAESNSDAVTEFTADLKGFVAKSVQGHSDSLSSLSHKLLETLQGFTQSGDSAVPVDAKVAARVLVMLEMEIKMLAQRANYGVRPAKANLYEDTSADALWIWEVGNVDKYFSDESQKTIKRMRKNRKRLGLQLKALARVVHLLHQTPVDEVKVSAEEAKVSKFVLAVESETQKAQDRERKELEKVQLAEQKKQNELEKEKAKQEEKRKREEDDEAERVLANKRKKSLVSYFRSIDSSSSTAPGAASGDGAAHGESESSEATTMRQADRRKARRASAQNEIMARMDATVAFLVCGEKTSELAASSVLSGDTKSVQQVRAHVQGERKSSERVTAMSGFWNSRRRRDPVLGVMKLLQFHENYRPAYFGTFSTKSRVFRGGRRPLAQYTKFDYTVDSEEEWEEEEPGESLSDADSDMEESDDDLDYGDQWLAYEDEVDYMDGAEDEETKDGDDGDGYLASPERKKKRVPEQKKRAKVPGRKKGAKPLKLEPQIVGPFLFEEASSSVDAAEQLSSYTGELLRQPVFESALMRKAREYEEEKERQRVLLEQQQKQQQLELEQQEKQKQIQPSAANESTAAGAQPAAVAPKQPKSQQTKTPTKTPQKRKASVENLASPQQIAPGAAPAAAAAVKSGIAAWLKSPKPAVVDLSTSTPEGDAATTTTTAPDAVVVDLSNHESDT